MTYTWPIDRKFKIVDYDLCDKFGSCELVTYQHNDTGVLIFCDGKHGTMYCTFLGERWSKSFRSTDTVLSDMLDCIKWLPKVREKAKRNIPEIKGWSMSFEDISNDVTYFKQVSHDLHFSITVNDFDSLFDGGNATLYGCLFDDGGYEQDIVFEKDYTIKSFSDIPECVSFFVKEALKE